MYNVLDYNFIYTNVDGILLEFGANNSILNNNTIVGASIQIISRSYLAQTATPNLE